MLVYTFNDTKNDFKRYVAATSDDFTPIGMQYLNQSIQACIYCVLGSIAGEDPYYSIVGHGGGSLETQQKFRKLVQDSVVNYSISTWIMNMNRAILDTNVVQIEPCNIPLRYGLYLA